MSARPVRVRRYQTAEGTVSIGGIRWRDVWEVCVACASQEEAEAVRDALLRPSLWLAVSHVGRVKYTTDRQRAEAWKASGEYRIVRDYCAATPSASETPEQVGARLYREGKGVSHFWGDAPDTSKETIERMSAGYAMEKSRMEGKP